MDVTEHARFRVLAGLPPYGPLAKSFPATWGAAGQEGYVVEFALGDSGPWVGNFRRSPLGFSRVMHHPDPRKVLVCSAGRSWVVDVGARSAEALPFEVDEIWCVPGSKDLVISKDGLAMLRLGAHGIVWHTRRLSWDGFIDIEVSAETIEGAAWSAVDDRWCPFSIETRTGKSSGGSFGESDPEGWERLDG